MQFTLSIIDNFHVFAVFDDLVRGMQMWGNETGYKDQMMMVPSKI